jgi:hypothetical protein
MLRPAQAFALLVVCISSTADQRVGEVLEQLDLLQYQDAFERAEIVGSDLPLLTLVRPLACNPALHHH